MRLIILCNQFHHLTESTAQYFRTAELIDKVIIIIAYDETTAFFSQ